MDEAQIFIINESGQTKSLNGGDDDDFSLAFTSAEVEDSGTAIASNNSVTLTGGGGMDFLEARTSASASNEGTAETSGNAVDLSGGADDDAIQAFAFGTASGPGSIATISGNITNLSGAGGFDILNVSVSTLASDSGIAEASSNVITVSGGDGTDEFSLSTSADTRSGGTARTSGNVVSLSGGAGVDTFFASTHASAEDLGSTATTRGDTLSMSGGLGADIFEAHTFALSSGGIAVMSDNAVNLSGDDGNDTLRAILDANASNGGSAETNANRLSLSGGMNNDNLSIELSARALIGNGTASLTGNQVNLDGGAGTDTLHVELSLDNSAGNATLSNNQITLDGGADFDTAEFGFALWMPGLSYIRGGSVIVTDETTGQAITVRNVEQFNFNGAIYSRQDLLNLIGTAPEAQADTGRTDQNTVLNVAAAAGLLVNDSDPDGDTLTITAVNGSTANLGPQITLASDALLVVNADGSYSYNPNGKFQHLGLNSDSSAQTTTDSFNYTVTDEDGNVDTATVTITVSGINDAPVALADAFGQNGRARIFERAEYVIRVSDLLHNDSDVDEGDAPQFVGAATTSATKGSLTSVSEGGETYLVYTYTGADLAANASTTASFTYTIQDHHGAQSTATVNLTISGLSNNLWLGTNESETLTGRNTADDTIDALGGNDMIFGLGGRDRLFGSGGDDSILAGDGHDYLDGGSGNDYLEGGRGNDAMSGGLGADVFAFKRISGATVNLGVDRIQDFQTGVDDLVLDTGIRITAINVTGDFDGNGRLDTQLTLSNNAGKIQIMDISHLSLSDWVAIA